MKMAARSLTATQVAAELGRSRDWLYANWRQLVTDEKMPPPVGEQGCLAWNAAQFYAWLDRGLTPAQRAACAAYRAAMDAYRGEPDPADTTFIASRRAALRQQFEG
jgi:predicted DNA-binding transcriptional regulator AlpA